MRRAVVPRDGRGRACPARQQPRRVAAVAGPLPPSLHDRRRARVHHLRWRRGSRDGVRGHGRRPAGRFDRGGTRRRRGALLGRGGLLARRDALGPRHRDTRAGGVHAVCLRRLRAGAAVRRAARWEHRRVLEKAGCRIEGRVRRSAVKDGVVQDQLLYAILRGDGATAANSR